MNENLKKILIIKPSALGDIVLAMPAACCLAESFPNARIDWFVRPEYAPLLENHPCVSNLVIFDRKKLGKWWCKRAAFIEFINLIKKLRQAKYDVVFDFQGRFRSAIFALLSGCKNRIGVADTQELTAIFYTQKIKQTPFTIHLVDFYLDMVCSAGAARSPVSFGLKPDKQAAQDIRNILKSNNANPDNYAVLVPAATVEAKRWPVENFAKLAEMINKKYQCDIVAVGIESEKEIIERLVKLSHVPLLNLAGQTDIKKLVALLAGAKVVVSNDTGPAHIASALGVPMVLIFGFTNPSRVGPYGRKETVAAIDAEKRGDEVESTNPAHSIKNVSVEQVFDSIFNQLR